MKQALAEHGPEFISRFGVLACGFNMGDYGVGAECDRVLGTFPCLGIGEMTLQSDDINNMTIKVRQRTNARR